MRRTYHRLHLPPGCATSSNPPMQHDNTSRLTQLGLRRQLSQKLGLTAGLYFTHHSNLCMTSPNPGIDVLGVRFWPSMVVCITTHQPASMM